MAGVICQHGCSRLSVLSGGTVISTVFCCSVNEHFQLPCMHIFVSL